MPRKPTVPLQQRPQRRRKRCRARRIDVPWLQPICSGNKCLHGWEVGGAAAVHAHNESKKGQRHVRQARRPPTDVRDQHGVHNSVQQRAAGLVAKSHQMRQRVPRHGLPHGVGHASHAPRHDVGQGTHQPGHVRVKLSTVIALEVVEREQRQRRARAVLRASMDGGVGSQAGKHAGQAVQHCTDGGGQGDVLRRVAFVRMRRGASKAAAVFTVGSTRQQTGSRHGFERAA